MSECPILVWMLSLNREYTIEEYEQCWSLAEQCITHRSFVKAPKNSDSFRQIITHMLPLLMMRHRRIPRAKWKDYADNRGKRWIEQSPDDIPKEKFPHSMIGYNLATSKSLCGMAMTQGERAKVVHIGLGITPVSTGGAPIQTYIESLAHKLTAREMSTLKGVPDPVALRRLCILLSLKEAYIHAVGGPVGFDHVRLDFDPENHKVTGDLVPLSGWEFRIFSANLGVARGNRISNENYECVCAFWRNNQELRFIWHQTPRELESWVQFINIDQMVKVIPKLSA